MNNVLQQPTLDRWLLKQDVIDQLVHVGEDSGEAEGFAERVLAIANTEEAEFHTISDPVDRSIALVLSLVKSEGLDAWNIDLKAFLTVFSSRVKSTNDIDLPACGRLIRMAWEVLHNQTESFYGRIQVNEEEDYDDEYEMNWQETYDEEEFYFTSNVLAGEFDTELPNLFEERIRREEGRPVTLGELLSAFKVAADEAEVLKQREENRRKHAVELQDYLENVGGRMHDEDLEGDIERAWRALKKSCSISKSSKVELTDVIDQLRAIILAEKGRVIGEIRDEAEVSSLISGLFLTHRKIASISQEVVPYGPIIVEDLWPEYDEYPALLSKLKSIEEKESQESEAKILPSEQLAMKIAQRAKEAEEQIQAELEARQAEEGSNWVVE